MDEDQLMALIGRLYVGTVLRETELRRLNALVYEYEAAAKQPPQKESFDVESLEPS